MNFSKVDEYLHQLPQCGIPGCELAVTYKGELVYRGGAGYANAEKTRPVSENDLYYIFSISKITTCVCAMRLVEEGRLELDDPVSNYLPAFTYLTVKGADGKPYPAQNVMTIRHLFTMTGGLNYDMDTAPLLRVRQDPNANTLSWVNAMAETALQFEPGTKYCYSLCHDVLAAVVEVISGMRFSDYVQKNVLEPLGMADTGYHLPDHLLPRLADMYTFTHRLMKATKIDPLLPGLHNDRYDSGGGGLYSSTNDQIKLLTVLANGGQTKDGYSLLRPETIRMMMVNQLPDSAMPQFSPTNLFGFGWGLCGRVHMNPVISRSRSAVGEFGWDGAAGAYGLVDPEKQVAIYYAMHVRNCRFGSHIVHPTLRNLAYEAIEG